MLMGTLLMLHNCMRRTGRQLGPMRPVRNRRAWQASDGAPPRVPFLR